MKTSFPLLVAVSLALSGCAGTPANTGGNTQMAAITTSTQEAPVEVVNTPVAVTDPNAKDDADQLVCKDYATIGTRFTQRICKTKAQIAEEREANKGLLDPSRTLASPGAPRETAPVGATSK